MKTINQQAFDIAKAADESSNRPKGHNKMKEYNRDGETQSLFQEILELRIPYGNHYSDLHVPRNEQTLALVKKYGSCATSFVNQVEGGLWLDIPMAFDPYWAAKLTRSLK